MARRRACWLRLLKTTNTRGTDLPEVALVGRSNVGKSSLINHLISSRLADSNTPVERRRSTFTPSTGGFASLICRGTVMPVCQKR